MSQVTCHRKGLELFGIICEMFHIFQGNGGLIKSHLKIYTHQKKNLLYIFSSYHELTHINLIFNSNTFIKLISINELWKIFKYCNDHCFKIKLVRIELDRKY